MYVKTFARALRVLSRGALFAFIASLALAAQAGIVVQSSTTSLGGNDWRLDYTLSGAAPAGGFNGLTIYFDSASFTGLSNGVAPLGWDPLLIQPDLSIPADGLFDVLHTAGPLSGTVAPTAFSVVVNAGAQPGAQWFELYLYDSVNLTTVASGMTVQVSSVPEPTTAALVLLALGAVALRGRRTGGARQAV
jgi:PEP-CTERM motif